MSNEPNEHGLAYGPDFRVRAARENYTWEWVCHACDAKASGFKSHADALSSAKEHANRSEEG
jgi:hypothetical protein